MSTHSSSGRLYILSSDEINELFGIPYFNQEERELYFSLTSIEHRLMIKYETISHRVHFILLLGYCKAQNNLFILNQNTPRTDIEYIYKKYFPSHLVSYRFKLSRTIFCYYI